MDRFTALSKDHLPEGPGSPGVKRHIAFKGEDFTILRSRLDPDTMSGWHHHGQYSVYGYVVSGSSRFDSGPGGKDVTSLGPGDFFFVPPFAIHRDGNPSPSEPQEVIIFLRGSGPLVVNVEQPEPG